MIDGLGFSFRYFSTRRRLFQGWALAVSLLGLTLESEVVGSRAIAQTLVQTQDKSTEKNDGLALSWQRSVSLPNPVGVAGAYAGLSGETVLAGGGANFPDAPPWEGGRKVWHDLIYRRDPETGQWTAAGKLPRPLGYGVSASRPDGIVCVGGSDSERHYSECFRLGWEDGQVTITALPSMPLTLANSCGAMVGNTLFVCGGTETPDATRPTAGLWSLDLSQPDANWIREQDCPGGPRLLAVAAGTQDELFVFGGADLTSGKDGQPQRQYRNDAWAFQVGRGWRRLADLPTPVVAAPTPAPVLKSGKIVLLGGDTGEHVGFQPPQQHPGFSRREMIYSPVEDVWETSAEESPAARVTVPLVKLKSGWLLISGEQRPGVRSPEVWQLTEEHGR